MTTIYAIENDIDNSVYVGNTRRGLGKRMREHLSESKRSRSLHKPLYIAIREYGQEHFSAKEIERCADCDAEEREKQWIQYYREGGNCLNVANGGKGKPLFNHDNIANMILRGCYADDICENVGCCKSTITDVANEYGLKLGKSGNDKKKVPVKCLSKFGPEIRSFDSVVEAALWISDENSYSRKAKWAAEHISQCVRGIRKSAYGYVWERF